MLKARQIFKKTRPIWRRRFSPCFAQSPARQPKTKDATFRWKATTTPNCSGGNHCLQIPILILITASPRDPMIRGVYSQPVCLSKRFNKNVGKASHTLLESIEEHVLIWNIITTTLDYQQYSKLYNLHGKITTIGYNTNACLCRVVSFLFTSHYFLWERNSWNAN